MKEDIPKRKMPFFFILKILSNNKHLFFYFIGTWKEVTPKTAIFFQRL